MYYINKIVGWALSPVGMMFLGLGLGTGLRCLRGSRRSRSLGAWIIGVVLVGFWVLACPITTRVIGVPLEGEEAPEAGTLQVGGYDAVVVLGGGAGIHKECGRVELFGAVDRIWKGVQLWKSYNDGNMPLVLGGGTDERIEPLMRDFGIPKEALKYFSDARNTEEEARMIASSGAKRILLVTSAWHMPRARMLFERVGLEVVAAPCDYEMHYAAEKPIEISDFFPSADCSALCRNSAAIKEWVARAGYRLLRR